MNMRSTIVAGAAVLASGAGLAMGGPAVEISEDGRVVVELVVELGAVREPALPAARDVAARFGGTADWSLSLRRQVGGLAVADFDGDGDNDVFVACYISNSFPPYPEWRDFILENTGGQLSSTPVWQSDIQTHTGDVQIGDLNGDGRVDVLTVHGGSVRSDAVRAYFNTASGLPTAAGWTSTIGIRAWGTSGLLVDLDNDSDLDIVTGNQGLSPDPFRPMFQFENLGGGLIATSPSWQSAEQSLQNGLAAGDFNGDGWMDVAVAKWVNFESGIYSNDGTGTLETTPSWTVGATTTDRGAAVADVDGDGDPDPYFGGDPSIGFELDNGSFTQVWANTDPLSGPQDFRFHDVDGDGDQDLAEIHFSTGRAYLYENDGGVLGTSPAWSFDASEVGTALAFGDINGDGLDDLVLGFSGDTSVRVFYAIPPAGCAADLTGDGVANLADVQAFVTAYTAQDPAADFTGDGNISFADVAAFIAAFNAGC